MNIISRLSPYATLLVLSLLIGVASLVPVPEMPRLGDVPFFDKWVHFVMYGALALAAWFDLCRSRRALTFGRVFWLAIVLPVVWGGLMELGQAYLTTCRSGDWLDFAANSFGVLIALPLGLVMKRFF